MRNLITATLAVVSTLVFIGCGGIEDTDKVTVFEADQKQCNLIFAKRDYMETIKDDVAAEELLKMCSEFQKENLGAHCTRTETITDRNGRDRTIKDDYTVNASACDEYK